MALLIFLASGNCTFTETQAEIRAIPGQRQSSLPAAASQYDLETSGNWRLESTLALSNHGRLYRTQQRVIHLPAGAYNGRILAGNRGRLDFWGRIGRLA